VENQAVTGSTTANASNKRRDVVHKDKGEKRWEKGLREHLENDSGRGLNAKKIEGPRMQNFRRRNSGEKGETTARPKPQRQSGLGRRGQGQGKKVTEKKKREPPQKRRSPGPTIRERRVQTERGTLQTQNRGGQTPSGGKTLRFRYRPPEDRLRKNGRRKHRAGEMFREGSMLEKDLGKNRGRGEKRRRSR